MTDKFSLMAPFIPAQNETARRPDSRGRWMVNRSVGGEKGPNRPLERSGWFRAGRKPLEGPWGVLAEFWAFGGSDGP